MKGWIEFFSKKGRRTNYRKRGLKNLLWYFLSFFVLIGCESDIHTIDSPVFAPTFGVSISELKKEEFEEVTDVDIPMYSKSNEDTIIVYTFDFVENQLLTKSWIISCNSTDSLALFNLFSKYSANIEDLYAPIVKEDSSRYVFNRVYNQLYKFKINEAENTVQVTYYYPLLK